MSGTPGSVFKVVEDRGSSQPRSAVKLHRSFDVVLLAVYLDSLGFENHQIFNDIASQTVAAKINQTDSDILEFFRIYKEEGNLKNRAESIVSKYNDIRQHFLNKISLKTLRGRKVTSYENRIYNILLSPPKSFVIEDFTAISTICTFYYEDVNVQNLIQGFNQADGQLVDAVLDLEFVDQLAFSSKRKREYVYQYWKTPENNLVEFIIKRSVEKKAWDSLKKHGKIQLKSNVLNTKSIPHSNFMVYTNLPTKSQTRGSTDSDFEVNII